MYDLLAYEECLHDTKKLGRTPVRRVNTSSVRVDVWTVMDQYGGEDVYVVMHWPWSDAKLVSHPDMDMGELRSRLTK